MSSESSSSYSDDSSSSSSASNEVAQKSTNKKINKSNNDPTDIEFRTMSHLVELEFTPRQMIKTVGKHGGSITLSSANGTLKFNGCDYAPDYEKIVEARLAASKAAEEALSTNNNNNGGTTPLGSKKKKKKNRHGMGSDASGGHYSDIVQKVKGNDMTTDWKKTLEVSLLTVPKYKKEAYANGSVYVTKVFLPGKINAVPQSIDFCDRTVTHGSIQFHDEHIGFTPQSLRSGISRDERKGYGIVDLSSPVIRIHNEDNPKAQFKGPSKGFEKHNQVKMDLAVIDKYTKIAEDEMNNKISYGNITDDFQVKFSVPIPTNRQVDHDLWVKTKGEKGKQFQGFCDAEYALPFADLDALESNGKTVRENFYDTPIHINCTFESKYRKCNGKPMLS
jgi:hypothetical protein